ncbi:esterase-like activity of phytase family protein [Croceibacter atlanticus]|uniref:esterase-like activity of phytase family protein n=1 Tax=Croceibacter atlanticus TaxID=313588 RepID=UPI0030D76531|tara:strand:+ start:123444 stop:124535 length:1092 start_codon:yes stop_codon:yes gene_type:complete
MKLKQIALILLISTSYSCSSLKVSKTPAYKVNYLDDYIYPKQVFIDGNEIGGLSGIDYDGTKYYLICDQPSKPRFYEADIILKGTTIDTVVFSKQHFIKAPKAINSKTLMDLESIRKVNDGFIISSEGSITNNKTPMVFYTDSTGAFIKSASIPEYFTSNGPQKPRNNGVFEGLTKAHLGKGFWVATELPLELDGPEPKVFNTTSLIRFTLFNDNGIAIKQLPYKLERLQKLPLLPFGVNGLTDMLQISENQFLVLERSYSAGYGTNGNVVQLILATNNNATNTLSDTILEKNELTYLEKELLFNFKSVKKQLSKKSIDNIEGITFGPKLPNGNLSLILVSDNNFNSLGEQLNQFILLELIPQ